MVVLNFYVSIPIKQPGEWNTRDGRWHLCACSGVSRWGSAPCALRQLSRRLCLTPANCLTLSDERLTFHTVHQRSGPLVGPEVGAESKGVHHSVRLCSAHNFFFFFFNLLQLFTTEESCWSCLPVCENLDTFPVCRPQAVCQPVVKTMRSRLVLVGPFVPGYDLQPLRADFNPKSRPETLTAD